VQNRLKRFHLFSVRSTRLFRRHPADEPSLRRNSSFAAYPDQRNQWTCSLSLSKTMKSSPGPEASENDWDALPTPKRGDKAAEAIYAVVGDALTQWEKLEEELAEIFSTLVGAPELAPVSNWRKAPVSSA
jgi:hypothetical protein